MNGKRPDWVIDVKQTANASLLVVKGSDGRCRGVRLSTKPLRTIYEDGRAAGTNP